NVLPLIPSCRALKIRHAFYVRKRIAAMSATVPKVCCCKCSYQLVCGASASPGAIFGLDKDMPGICRILDQIVRGSDRRNLVTALFSRTRCLAGQSNYAGYFAGLPKVLRPDGSKFASPYWLLPF